MVKFLSDEWFEHGKIYMKENVDSQALRKISISLLCIVDHIPPDDKSKNFFLQFQEGELAEFTVNTGNAEDMVATYILQGNYGTYKGVLQGEMKLAIAILKNRLKLKGDKMQALKLIKPLNGVIVALQEITDEYEE